MIYTLWICHLLWNHVICHDWHCLHSFITVESFVLSLTTHIHNISLAIAQNSPVMLDLNKSDGNGQTITQMLTSGLRSEDKERVDMLCECPEMTSQRSCYCSNPSQILDQISPISAKRNSPSFPLPLALHSRLTLQKWLTYITLPEGKTSARTNSHHVFSTLSWGNLTDESTRLCLCLFFLKRCVLVEFRLSYEAHYEQVKVYSGLTD